IGVGELLRVVAEEIGRLLHVTEGLHPVLAHLEGGDGGELHAALGDEVRGGMDQPCALLPRRAGPLDLRLLCDAHCAIDILFGRGVETREQRMGLERRSRLEEAATLDGLVANPGREGPSQLLADLRDGGVELAIEFTHVCVHDRVGDAKAHTLNSSSAFFSAAARSPIWSSLMTSGGATMKRSPSTPLA